MVGGVADLAHQLFDHVLQRDHPDHLTRLVDDAGHVRAA
jgi:hypothetical protein